MKTEMNPSHPLLCAATVPFTTELFGDDVTNTIIEITSQNRVALKALQETSHQWGRGRLSRSRYHLYGGGRTYSSPYCDRNPKSVEGFHQEKPKNLEGGLDTPLLWRTDHSNFRKDSLVINIS